MTTLLTTSSSWYSVCSFIEGQGRQEAVPSGLKTQGVPTTFLRSMGLTRSKRQDPPLGASHTCTLTSSQGQGGAPPRASRNKNCFLRHQHPFFFCQHLTMATKAGGGGQGVFRKALLLLFLSMCLRASTLGWEGGGGGGEEEKEWSRRL